MRLCMSYLYLEMWLVKDVGELSSCVTAMRDGTQVPQDVLQKLHVFVPHRLETRFLRTFSVLQNKLLFLQRSRHIKSVCVFR